MDFPSLTAHDRQHEFHFGPADVRTFTVEFGREDLRTRWDKLALRKMAPQAPAWTLGPDVFELTCGGGSIGVGTLWTRPVALDPAPGLAGAYFTLLERRDVRGASGEQNLIAHLRAEPHVGDGDDLAKLVTPLHAEADAADAAWHGQFVDLSPLVKRPGAARAYLTIEVHASCTRHETLQSALAYRYRALALSLVIRHPTQIAT